MLLAFGLLLLYLAFNGQDMNRIISDLRDADYFWVFMSLLAVWLAHVFRAIRWQMLIRPLGYRPKLTNTYHAVIIGYLANLALPRMGEVTRCGVLNRTDKVPVNALIGTVITERLIDLFCLLLVTALAVLLEFDLISGFVIERVQALFAGTVSGAAVTGIIIGFFLLIYLGIRYYFKRNKFKLLRWNFFRKMINMLAGFRKGFTSIAKMENRTLFWTYTAVIWGFYLLASWFGFKVLKSTEFLDLGVAAVILALGSLGMAAPVQGGIGPYHWMVSEGLTFFGLSREAGLAYATISHTSAQILLILILGAVSMLAVFFETYKRKRQERDSSASS